MASRDSFSRAELVEILGQPAMERITKSEATRGLDGTQTITVKAIDESVDGAIRALIWRCDPVSIRGDAVAREFEPAKTSSERAALLGEAWNILEAMADNCKAVSWIRNGRNDVWVLRRVCSRHRHLGLEPSHLDPFEP